MSGVADFTVTVVPPDGGEPMQLDPINTADTTVICPADAVRSALADVDAACRGAWATPRTAVHKMLDDFMAGLASRGPLLITDDVGVTCEVGDAPCAMKVTLSGKTAWGNAYLAELASWKGRDCLPFPVPEEIPADMDPRLVAAMPELHAYYDDNMTWGSLHIVLDDGNVADEDVDLCLGQAKECGDHAGTNIARLLQAVSPAQRMMLHQWWYGRGPFEVAR